MIVLLQSRLFDAKLLWTVGFCSLVIQMQTDIQDLNESPIDLDEQVIIASQSSSQSQEEEAQEYETFKGSFLLEMEKLTRPLLYEKQRYSIFSLQYEESDQNILCFIENEEGENQPLSLNVDEGQCSEYIVDFDEMRDTDCCCRCHERQRSEIIKNVRRNSEYQIGEIEQKGEKIGLGIMQKLQLRSKERKLTSISLKQYKQHIKKKLQQKR